jgi:hypothetical protein
VGTKQPQKTYNTESASMIQISALPDGPCLFGELDKDAMKFTGENSLDAYRRITR